MQLLYCEPLLSIEHVQKFLYQRHVPVDNVASDRVMAQADKKCTGEAECRIPFFAQSLTTEIPQLIPVDAMPTFFILIPLSGF